MMPELLQTRTNQATGRILVLSSTPGIVKFLREGWGEERPVIAVHNLAALLVALQEGPVEALFIDEEPPRCELGDILGVLPEGNEGVRVPVAVMATSRESELRRQQQLDDAVLVVDPATPKNKVVAWIRHALRNARQAHEPPALDQDMASAIVAATKEVMQTMMDMEVTEGSLQVGKTNAQTADVIGTIHVDGFVRGSITLFLPGDLAQTIAQRMLGEEPAGLSDAELVDAIGELTNMIAGNIKTHLCKQRELFGMSTPMVTIGREVRRVPVRKELAFLLPCSWQDRQMLVEVSLVPQRQRGPGVAGREHG